MTHNSKDQKLKHTHTHTHTRVRAQALVMNIADDNPLVLFCSHNSKTRLAANNNPFRVSRPRSYSSSYLGATVAGSRLAAAMHPREMRLRACFGGLGLFQAYGVMV